MRAFLCLVAVVGVPASAAAQGRARAAREAAEALVERFGAKAGRSAPELAGQIERVAAKHGDEAIAVLRKSGPEAAALVEAAGADGAKALRALTVHGEQAASRVLARPTAMKQFLQHGDEAAAVLVRHPGVAEPLIERGGSHAVKALQAVNPQNGRRLAMLTEGELASSAARHPEVLAVVAKHGDRATEFLWKNKGVLAGGAALAAFLANPEPYLNGTQRLVSAAGESVVKPVVGGVFTLLTVTLVAAGILLLAVIGLAYKHGPPKGATLEALRSWLK